MSRVSKAWEALQDLSQQGIETVTRSARVDIVGGGIDEIDPPEDIDEYAEWAKNTAIIRANMRKFVHDVWEPGYRIEGPDETIAYFEGEQEDLDASPPEGTPENGFLSQCAIYGGERNQDFYELGKESTWQRWVRGTVLHELIKADPDDPESEITGFHFIRPETVYPRVLNNTNILLPAEKDQLPDDINERDVETTKRGEVAAYVQFDDESILGLRKSGFDRQDIPLSQNDVLKQTLEPDIGGDIGTAEGVFGTSILAAIDDEIAEYKQIKRDRAEAISRKAYGVWTAQFTPEVLEVTKDQNEIIRWNDDSIENTEGELNNMGPGDVLTTDASLDLERHDSDVPNLDPVLMHYVNEISSALPTPLPLAIDFAADINRDVTSDQRAAFEQTVSEERQAQERYWTNAIRIVAKRKGLPVENLKFKIEPEQEENPVKSLDSETINRMNTYISTLSAAAGPIVGPSAIVSREQLLDVMDFPVEETNAEQAAEEMADMANDEEAAQAWRDIMGVEALESRYSEGDVVDTPDGLGVVSEIRTESFEGTNGDVEASDDSPAYVVALNSEDKTVGFYTASDLEASEFPEVDVESPEKDLEAMMDMASAMEGNYESLQEGFFEWPESWEESPQPARLIALKAWAGMGGRWRGCRREMTGNIASPERFCSDFKDRILGWEGWRRGG